MTPATPSAARDVPIVVSRMATPEWKAVEKKLPAGSLAVGGGRMFAWLQDGMQPQFRDALRSTVPPPVVWAPVRR